MPTPLHETGQTPESTDGPPRSRMRSVISARFRQLAALLGETSPETASLSPSMRVDRSQSNPPRPHFTLTAHRVWSEILKSAIGDDADTSLIHDLASLHPQVTESILQTVNSAQGGMARPVQDVALAIELLGLRQLRRLATEQLSRVSLNAGVMSIAS